MKDSIIVRVNSLTIEKHSYRTDGGEQGKIGFEQVDGGPFESLYFSASLPPGAPIPYQLGDRLVMTIERPVQPSAPTVEEQAQLPVIEGPDGVCMNCGRHWGEAAGGACRVADLHPPPTRDEVVGLGASEVR